MLRTLHKLVWDLLQPLLGKMGLDTDNYDTWKARYHNYVGYHYGTRLTAVDDWDKRFLEHKKILRKIDSYSSNNWEGFYETENYFSWGLNTALGLSLEITEYTHNGSESHALMITHHDGLVFNNSVLYSAAAMHYAHEFCRWRFIDRRLKRLVLKRRIRQMIGLR